MFNPDVSAAVVAAKFCRVVIYPAVRGWCGAGAGSGCSSRWPTISMRWGTPIASAGQGIGWCRARRRSEWRRRLHG